MTKIIIISYFFPPCTLTAAQRIAAWAKYFHRFGLFPIVITRNWGHPVINQADILKPGGDKIIHEKHENYEVYYLPHKGSTRDRLYYKLAGTPWAFLTKPFTFLELIGQNYLDIFTPFKYIRNFASSLIEKDREIKKIIISGNPFILFKFGFQLKKRFAQLDWVADYRDDWSTSGIVNNTGILGKFIRWIEAKSEKKWLSNVQFITSVSPFYADKIGNFIHKKRLVHYNGFDELQLEKLIPQKEFIIVYNGTLYSTQNIEVFCEVFIQLIRDFKHINFKLKFPGLAFDLIQSQRVRTALKTYEENVEITERIPQKEVIKIQQQSHVLLMIAHNGIKGVTSSKLFEYFSVQRPIVVFPNDNDVLETLVKTTQTGFVCNDAVELYDALAQLIHQFEARGITHSNINEDELFKYSRKNQCQILANAIISDAIEG